MKKRVITISRQHGSGGRAIGHLIEDKLGIKCYDQQLIEMIAKESGFAADFIEENGEKVTNSLLFNIATSLTFAYNTFSKERMSLQDQLFVAQGRVIKELADKEPCIIVGSCADYFLAEREDVLNVFIHANMDFRKKTAIERYGYDEKDVQTILSKKDRERASHYRYYTEQEWASAPNYHVCLDSSMYGLEKCADIIADLYKND